MLVLAAAAAVTVLLALAASSGPVRLWDRTPPASSVAPAGSSLTPVTRPPDAVVVDEPRNLRRWEVTVLQILALLFLALVLSVGFPMARSWSQPARTAGAQAAGGHEAAALPDVALPDVVVDLDVGAARRALTEGPPRNAIVACWMQLERDAADAGLARRPAETSAEYAQRVVALGSVDPAPIGALASLYREARFSGHELTDAHRARALDALDRVAAALAGGDRPVTV
jgi:hypothetical protein